MLGRLYQWLVGRPRGNQLETVLDGMRVRDLMNRDVRTARPEMSVAELMELMLREHHLGFPVVDDVGDVVGMVSLQDVRDKPTGTRVDQIMRTEVPMVEDKAPASDALHLMTDEGFNRVVAKGSSGHISGIITRTDVMNRIRFRQIGWPAVNLRG